MIFCVPRGPAPAWEAVAMERWRPNQEPTKQEQFILKRLEANAGGTVSGALAVYERSRSRSREMRPARFSEFGRVIALGGALMIRHFLSALVPQESGNEEGVPRIDADARDRSRAIGSQEALPGTAQRALPPVTRESACCRGDGAGGPARVATGRAAGPCEAGADLARSFRRA